MLRNGSRIVLLRSLKWTACLLTVLALVVPVQAGHTPGAPGQQDAGEFVAETAAWAQDAIFGLVPPTDPNAGPAGGALSDAQSAAKSLQQEANTTVKDVQAAADPAALRALLDEALKPVHRAVKDAQQQMDALLTPDAPEPQSQSTEMAPQSSIKAVWPGLSEPVLIIGAAVLGLGIVLWFVGQSATVGAGAAGTAALNDGRKFLPYASPMFTRFEKDTVLGHPKREAIYGTIIGTPGITLQDLCEDSGLSRTAVTHHLRLLEHQHLIVSKRVGRSRHFFENGGRYGRDQKDAYAVLHNDRSKDIHAFIQAHPGAIQKDLCSKFDIQASVAHWHVKRLLEANLLEAVRQGRTVSYFPSTDVAAPAYA